jgi:serine/threonine-protein kinase
VLAGAKYAHAHSIVHRDLKPQNVLVDAEGRARVTDFGIARAGVSEITQTGSVLGTAQYLSPEQAQGLPVTAASDIYSIGVLLYEALTGRVPFEAESPVSVALKQVSERPRPPSELNPAVSRALDAVVLKALAKDPANRYASADEFLAALDAAQRDPSGAALGDTAAHEAVAVAAGTPPPAPPEGPPERRGFFTPARLVAMALLLLLLGGLIAYLLTRPEQVLVPTVFGFEQSRAERVLEDAGFEVAVRSVPNDAPEGRVLEQDPPAGDRADEGSTVTITVSKGLGTVLVPDVSGQPAAQARQALESKGFRVRRDERPSRAVRAGLAIETEPPAGTELGRGQRVTLVISSGAKLVTVPSVVGLDQDVAESQLRDAGLIPDIELRDADELAGEVISQDPAAGETVRTGTTITVNVSTGEGSAFTPNVVGQSEDEARADLEDAGLRARVVRRSTTDPNEDDQVLDQSPTAGTQLRRGEFVTIYVGRFQQPTTTTTPTTPPPSP